DHPELHLHSARAKATGSRPDPWNTQGLGHLNEKKLTTQGGLQMSFKKFDKQTFVIDSANAYTDRRISKREFLRRMGLAGVGFSAFGLGMLGGHRRGSHGFGLGESAYADGLPDNQAKWLKEVGSKFKGAKIRYTTE